MRKLSSSLTWFYKFVFPTIWIGGFGFGMLTLFQMPASAYPNNDNPALIFLFGLIVGSIFLYLVCMRLKSVKVDGPDLVISNYFRKIRVPLKNVESASGSILLQPVLVWVNFRISTEFGSRIYFMPHIRVFMTLRKSPIVQELSDTAENSRFG